MGTHPIFESDFDCLTEMAFRRIFGRAFAGRAAPILLAGVGFYALPVNAQEACFTPSCNTISAKSAERTFIAIKPDGVQRGLVGEILKRFEQRGYKLVAMKLCRPGKEHLETHYEDLKGKGFFNGLIEYMNSGPICAMVWEGKNVVKMGRMMLGETNPQASLPGSIRGDFSIEVGRNICHGSDAVESANAEIALWFKPEELISWDSCSAAWTYE